MSRADERRHEVKEDVNDSSAVSLMIDIKNNCQQQGEEHTQQQGELPGKEAKDHTQL